MDNIFEETDHVAYTIGANRKCQETLEDHQEGDTNVVVLCNRRATVELLSLEDGDTMRFCSDHAETLVEDGWVDEIWASA